MPSTRILSEDVLKRFVLGRLPEETRTEIEDLALRDEETFDLIEAAETELIDLYARDRMSASDRRAFAQRLAPLPRVRERIANARALASAADHHSEWSPAPSTADNASPWRLLLPLAASFFLVIVGAFAVYRVGLPWLSEEDPSASAAAGVVFDIAPGALRDAGASQVVHPGERRWIGLRFDLEDPGVRSGEDGSVELEFVLVSAARDGAVRRRRLAPEELASGAVTWLLPSRDLDPGDYTILLREPAADRILAHYEIAVR